MRKRKKKRKEPASRFPLREIITRKGWTQRRLARAIGMDEQRVSDLCHGRHQPTWPTILKLLTAMECDLGDLAPKGGAA